MNDAEIRDRADSIGITMLSVLLGVAATVALGIEGEWWLRSLVGLAVLLLLMAVIKLGTRRGAGPISKLGSWMLRR